MAFRPPNFSPVLPLSMGAAVSKTLAGVLQRFGDRKDREKQQRQELIAALELQNIKQQNAVALSRLQSQFRTEEDVAQFKREAPVRQEKVQTERFNRLDELSGDFDLTEEQTQDIFEGNRPRGTLKRKPFRPLRPLAGDRVAQRAKLNKLGGMDANQLVDNLRATGKVSVRDREGKLTGEREFTTPEHKQQFDFTKDLLELKKAGLNDIDLEKAGMSLDDAIALKKRFIFPTLDKTGKRVSQQKLSRAQIVKLIKAGVNLEMIDSAMVTLRQRPEYSKFTNEQLIRLIINSIE